MVARKPTTIEGGQKKTASEADKPKKPTPVKKPTPAKHSKHMKEKTTQPPPIKKIHKGKVAKILKGKSSLQLVDEDEEVQHEPEPQIENDEYNLQRGIHMSLESFQAPVGEVAIREPTSVRDTPSPPNAETGVEAEMSDSESDTKILNVGEEKGEDVFNTVVLEERIVELDEGQAGSDPGNTLES
ncbi:hypothetical protein Tco_0728261 [Tanacetum coccineum]|uniref:Uncharacterized protein n=1 Tax=Tanacetum coccineum TaxID=301880 RepID=A0ABQ4YLI3_9ASTR